MIAVFRSRAETIRFYNKLKLLGVAARTVPTPANAAEQCGISVYFPPTHLDVAEKILISGLYQSFVRFVARG